MADEQDHEHEHDHDHDHGDSAELPLAEELFDQLTARPLGEFLFSTASTIYMITAAKLASGAAEEARLGIDALRALSSALASELEEQQKRDLDQGIAKLQLEYAAAVSDDAS